MKTIIFYDGECSFCNYWVNWILKGDKNRLFYFSSLQSEFAHQFSVHFDYKFPPETIVVWEEQAGFLIKSDAVIFILQNIKPNSFQLKALKLFPKILRDTGYRLFAYFRKFITINKCEVPSADDKKRFLTDKLLKDFMNMPKV